jgi:hypothetical protein
MSQQRKNALLGNGWPPNNVKAVFSMGSDPRLYNSDTGAMKLVMASDAMSSQCGCELSSELVSSVFSLKRRDSAELVGIVTQLSVADCPERLSCN